MARKISCKNVKVRKSGKYVRVYTAKGKHMWTHNLENPLRNWGNTSYRKCAVQYIKKRGL